MPDPGPDLEYEHRGPRTTVLAILRDIAYDDYTRRRLGVSGIELRDAHRWAEAMPGWQRDITDPGPPPLTREMA
jgi:hypothetical protein